MSTQRRPDRLVPNSPFTTADARDAWSPEARRQAVLRGDWVRLQRGVFDIDDPLDRDRAALRIAVAATMTCERGVLSQGSAALALGLPVLARAARACLTVQAGTALRNLARVHLHRATLTDDEVLELAGRLITAPARTVVDVAREHGFAAGVVVADSALRHGLVSEQDLLLALERCAGWPGRRAAARVVAFADALAESPLESLSRIAIARSGLPAPVLQQRLGADSGTFIGRCDFYWPAFGVVGECDGLGKYDIDGVVQREEHRQVEFLDCGLIVVHWGWRDLYGGRWLLGVRRLQDAMRRGYPPGSAHRGWLELAARARPIPPLTPRLPLR